MNATTHPAVREYLKAVDRALDGLPRARRDEIVDELREHVDAALAETGQTEADVRTVLDRLGSPADIAAEARERFGVQERKRHVLEPVALVLITGGSLVFPFVGWLAGIALVYVSRVWTARDRLLATLLFPFGFLPALWLLWGVGGIETDCFSENYGPEVCEVTHQPSLMAYVLLWTVFLLSVLGPFVTAFVLGRRLRRAATL
jgi:hypothetical protein